MTAARVLRESDHSVLAALILSLGEFPVSPSSEASRTELLETLEQVYREHPDPGVHSAARWLLNRWGMEHLTQSVDSALAKTTPELWRGWYVDKLGITMAVLRRPPPFQLGSPNAEDWREEGFNHGDERQHTVRIPRSFAISADEITLSKFRAKFPSHKIDPVHLATLDTGQVDDRCPEVDPKNWTAGEVSLARPGHRAWTPSFGGP